MVVWDNSGGDIACDVSIPDSVSAAIDTTTARHGPSTRLVTCAGVGATGLLLDQTRGDWQRVLDVNLTGTRLAMRAVARTMVEAGDGGSIVAVSSISGGVWRWGFGEIPFPRSIVTSGVGWRSIAMCTYFLQPPDVEPLTFLPAQSNPFSLQ